MKIFKRHIFWYVIVFSLLAMNETVHASGELSLWTTLNNLNYTIFGCPALAINNRIYVFSGRNGEFYFSSIESATVNQDGTLSDWTAISYLTTPQFLSAAVEYNNRVYVSGGESNSGIILSTIESATVNKDGTFSDWTVISNMGIQLEDHASVVANDYLYLIAGGNVNFLDEVRVCSN